MQGETREDRKPTRADADNALDTLDFTAVAVARMMGEYSDSVTNGAFVTMTEAIETLRKYVNDGQEA